MGGWLYNGNGGIIYICQLVYQLAWICIYIYIFGNPNTDRLATGQPVNQLPTGERPVNRRTVNWLTNHLSTGEYPVNRQMATANQPAIGLSTGEPTTRQLVYHLAPTGSLTGVANHQLANKPLTSE